jgi:hypothetical protein
LKQSIAKPTPWRERLVLLSASLEFSTFPVQDSANAVYNMSAIKAVLRYVIQFYLMDANIIPKMVCRLKSQMKCHVWAWKNWSLSPFVCSAVTKDKISVLACGQLFIGQGSCLVRTIVKPLAYITNLLAEKSGINFLDYYKNI